MTPVDPYILQQASCRASLLVSTAGFRSDDWEDLKQEMVLDLLYRSPKFNPSRGSWHGFVRGVVRHQAVVLAVKKHRHAGREFLVGDFAEVEISGPHEYPVEGISYTPMTALPLRIDIGRVLERLPKRLRSFARLLMIMSIGDACLKMGKSRTRGYQMRQELKEAFQRAGYGPRGSELTR